jgi:transposase-like protein
MYNLAYQWTLAIGTADAGCEHVYVEMQTSSKNSAQFKAEAVGACQQPGVSVAAVALARGLNGALLHHNWLFAGSLRAGQRDATVMSLIQSAKLNGHDPYRYLKDVLERLPTQPVSRIQELLPHHWQR